MRSLTTCCKCDLPYEKIIGKRTLYCGKHYRVYEMRQRARKRGKSVPSFEQLDSLIRSEGQNLCHDCGKSMHMLSDKSNYADTLSLQHYRDGTFGIVCGSCNSRHVHYPGDTYKEYKDTHKFCKGCEEIKPFADFYPNRTIPGVGKLTARCRECVKLVTRKMVDSGYEKDRYYARKLGMSMPEYREHLSKQINI